MSPLLTNAEKRQWTEIFTVLRQAIIDHGVMFRDKGKLHGNICPQTVGNKNGIGYLLDPNDRPFNPAFQSMLRLENIIYGDPGQNPIQTLKQPPTSYAHELESFFYVIAYWCIIYSRRADSNSPNHIWISNPVSVGAVMAKERISDKCSEGANLPWPHSTGEAVLFTGFFKTLVRCLNKAVEADRSFQTQASAYKYGPSQSFVLESYRTASKSPELQRMCDVMGAYGGFVAGIDEVLSRIEQL